MSVKLRETEQALEQEKGDRVIMVQQHRVAEEHLRARLKASGRQDDLCAAFRGCPHHVLLLCRRLWTG